MNKKIFLACAVVLATIAIFAAGPQNNPTASQPDKPMEAARLNNLGAAYMNQQLFEKALKLFEQAATLDPKFQIATMNQGIALLNLGRVDPARKFLEQAVKENPRDPHAWYNLGMLEKNSANSGAAADAFRHVTEIDPNDPDTWYFLGASYAQNKQYPEAIDAFQHALKLNPLHASAEFGLSRAYQQSADLAQAREHLARFQYITQNKLGSPISLAYGEQGKYSLAEESPEMVQKVPPQIPVRFVDVTEQAGLKTKPSSATANDLASYLGPGACFLDYDGDGLIDLFLPDDGKEGGMSLYHNLGGKFEDVTMKTGLDPTLHAIGCTAGDYDNDGFTDLAVSDGNRILLLHNEKNGTFKDKAEAAGIHYEQAANDITGLTFIDYDHDGDIDLYAAEAPSNQFPGPVTAPIVVKPFRSHSIMWRNNGNGTFTDVSSERGLDVAGLNAIGTDFDNDRAVDLVVTGGSYLGAALFLKNPREGEFQPSWAESTGRGDVALGVAVLDYDHDGWMDFAFTHSKAGLTLVHNDRKPPLGSISYLVNQTDKSRSPQELKIDWVRSYGVAAIDYDNDGWVDLVAVGETKDGKGEVRLFRNLGPDGFKDVTTDVGLDKIHVVIHPQSTIHSMVEFVDGSILAQLGPTDMRMPIQYALTYPERVPSNTHALDWSALKKLDFEEVPAKKFPCLTLAKQALRQGGPSPCALNAADEIAVAAFLEERLEFLEISAVIEAVLGKMPRTAMNNIEDVLQADGEARRLARIEVERRRN